MASKAKREWYKITAQADPSIAEFRIYDEIGEVTDFWTGEVTGVSGKKFAADVQALPDLVKTIRVYVGSLGGNPFDGIIIANVLREQSRDKGRRVDVIAEFAASAATLVTSAGDDIKMPSNGFMMIHNPEGALRASGDSSIVRAAADKLISALDTVRNSMVETYRWVCPMTPEDIRGMMDRVTWMSAEEAMANGFCTEILEPVQVQARFRPEVLAKLGEIPEAYRERVAALVQASDGSDRSDPDIQGILAACKAGGCLDLAEELVAARATLEQATARIAEAKEIRGLCAAAKLPELAEGYIRHRMPAADVRAQLTLITAKQDGVEIRTDLPPDGDRPARPASRLNAFEIERQRNQAYQALVHSGRARKE